MHGACREHWQVRSRQLRESLGAQMNAAECGGSQNIERLFCRREGDRFAWQLERGFCDCFRHLKQA